MSENPPVNRALKDKAMDLIDHALGRPVWPMRESYRNYFAANTDGAEAKAFASSPHWERGREGKGLANFHVTRAGRKALAEHLKSLGVHQVFVVAFEGQERVVSAATAAKARYDRFLDISDVIPDLTFGQFQRRSTVRKAAA